MYEPRDSAQEIVSSTTSPISQILNRFSIFHFCCAGFRHPPVFPSGDSVNVLKYTHGNYYIKVGRFGALSDRSLFSNLIGHNNIEKDCKTVVAIGVKGSRRLVHKDLEPQHPKLFHQKSVLSIILLTLAMGPKSQHASLSSPSSMNSWKLLGFIGVVVFVPWAFYWGSRHGSQSHSRVHVPTGDEIKAIFRFSHEIGQSELPQTSSTQLNVDPLKFQQQAIEGHSVLAPKPPKSSSAGNRTKLPVMGPIPTAGSVPLYGTQHHGDGDAIFALACNYPKNFYQRFVGSLRKSGYKDDVVLAVSPPSKMKPGVERYIQETNVVAYAFEVDCMGVDNCKLKDDFLGYPDPRPYRTFANIRYALYEYWLVYYTDRSYILILDFRDTFFQLDPFLTFGPYSQRVPGKYDLQLYAENYKVQSVSLQFLLTLNILFAAGEKYWFVQV
jgi:hypothetical protein